MYLLKIYFKNTKKNSTGKLYFKTYRNKIAKWTQLPPSLDGLELLQLIALACGGIHFSNRIPDLKSLLKNSYDYAQLEFMLRPHLPIDGVDKNIPPLFGSGIQINKTGLVTKIKPKDYRFLPPEIPKRNLRMARETLPIFLLDMVLN